MMLRHLPTLLLASVIAVTAASAKVTEKFTRSYPLAAGGTVSIGNMNGDIEIVAWDKAEVSVDAEKTARDGDALKRIEIVVDVREDRIEIKTKHHRDTERSWWSRGHQSGSVRYTLRVPAELARLKVDVMNSNVTTENVRADVKISTMNGRVRATGLAGNTTIDTMNGRIYASFDKVGSGQKLSLDTMNGSCEVQLPADASAQVVASTMNGRVTSEIPMTIERSTRRSLRGTIGQGQASLSVESMNGSLKLRARS